MRGSYLLLLARKFSYNFYYIHLRFPMVYDAMSILINKYILNYDILLFEIMKDIYLSVFHVGDFMTGVR